MDAAAVRGRRQPVRSGVVGSQPAAAAALAVGLQLIPEPLVQAPPRPDRLVVVRRGRQLLSRLRGGSAGAARGAQSFLTATVSRVRHAGATGPLTVRTGSAFYAKAVIGTAVKFDVRFSITAGRTSRSGPRSSRSPTARGSRSRAGCGRRRCPAPTPPLDTSRHLLPSSRVIARTPGRSAWWCAGSARPQARSWRCSRPGTTTRSLPTDPCRWLRPTTAGTPSLSRPSPSSRAPGWRTCPRGREPVHRRGHRRPLRHPPPGRAPARRPAPPAADSPGSPRRRRPQTDATGLGHTAANTGVMSVDGARRRGHQQPP